MSNPLLPRTISGRLAAKIAGRSYGSLKRVLYFMGEEGPRRVDLALFERDVLHREISVEEYLAAERSLDHRREMQRESVRAGSDVIAV
jgi:hypothetical protein